MTREEAITVLRGLSENPLFSNQHKAAFSIAIHDIKAHHDWDINNLILINKDNYEPLEQEPTTKNDLGVDCISRKAVLDLPKRTMKNYFGEVTGEVVDVKDIMKLPSVTPQEPRKGHWISHREHCENLGVMPSGLGAYEWCSNCDCGIDVREWHRNQYNYCPNCGADMREVEE